MRPAPVLAALGLLWAATPVDAHCYSIWRFPFRQHCGVAHVQLVASLSQPSPPAKPVLDEDAARAKAIERLKLILGEIQ
jgi:hypothetical protein